MKELPHLKCTQSFPILSYRRQSSSSSSGSSCEDSIDPAIEKKLKQSALRNNLTHENVKNILHKVVRNDHVLAIVKLKEEELEKHEQAQKFIKLRHDEDEDAPAALPKLTRAKAKALNKLPLPLAPLKNTQPDSDVVALINEELRSDDDDEEYQPGDDDIEVIHTVDAHFVHGFVLDEFTCFFIFSCTSRLMTTSIRPHRILIRSQEHRKRRRATSNTTKK